MGIQGGAPDGFPPSRRILPLVCRFGRAKPVTQPSGGNDWAICVRRAEFAGRCVVFSQSCFSTNRIREANRLASMRPIDWPLAYENLSGCAHFLVLYAHQPAKALSRKAGGAASPHPSGRSRIVRWGPLDSPSMNPASSNRDREVLTVATLQPTVSANPLLVGLHSPRSLE